MYLKKYSKAKQHQKILRAYFTFYLKEQASRGKQAHSVVHEFNWRACMAVKKKDHRK